MRRFILCLTLMVFSIHGTGALSVFHNLSAHIGGSVPAEHADSFGCSDGHSQTSQAPNDKPESPTPEDTDCDLCLFFKTTTPIPATYATGIVAVDSGTTIEFSDLGVCFVKRIPTNRSTRGPPALIC